MEIVLIRHGKPQSAVNPRVNIQQYRDWIRDYDLSLVAEDSRSTMSPAFAQDAFLYASTLPRAIHSCRLFVAKEPMQTCEVFNEMAIPHYGLPLKLKAWTWVYLSRLLWFCGVKGPFESFSQAKLRARRATQLLQDKAKHEKKVVLFGHGVMNYAIRNVLVEQGWQLEQKNSEYWGITRLTKSS